ncbi:uncharacterized protein LOC132256443 [Phlebotomus argentipes]|uniref:uncharacterized protein LOC132256443 n=1 Tax=Phlebotomus argentipes TaxID=94469 RepID=UPI002892FA53|nr:uncharacterized protein LOC132256443 [Phlebotomus argentipes]
MFRKHVRNGTRSNRDSGVASMSSLQSELEHNASCRTFYKICDLTNREERYVKMLQTLVIDYKKCFTLALDPHHFSPVSLTRLRKLCGQERKIFFFFEHLLDLHRDFCELLHDCESAVDVGRIFLDWMSENDLDIYIKHWLLNPLQRQEVQHEFDAFMSECLGHAEILGLDAYTAPANQLHYYKKTLLSLCEVCSSVEDLAGLHLIQKSLEALSAFISRCDLSAEALDIENSEANLALIGHCVSRGEFQAREYTEGLKVKVILQLFQRGLIVILPRKCPKSHALRHIFHSFYNLQHVDVKSTDDTIRLKSPETGKTCYKIKERHTLLKKSKSVSMRQFIDTIAILKEEELNTSDVILSTFHPPVEAVNHHLIHRMRFRTFSWRYYGLSVHSISSTLEDDGKHLEAFNVALIERFTLQEPSRRRELHAILHAKMEFFRRIQEMERERIDDLILCPDDSTEDCFYDLIDESDHD